MDNGHNRNHDVLDSWKEICQYLDKGVRTCQRWERDLALPIHRYKDSPKSKVFAYKSEIDEWLRIKSLNSTNPFSHRKQLLNIGAFIIFFTFTVVIILIATRKNDSGNGAKTSPNPINYVFENNIINLIDSDGNHLWALELDPNNNEEYLENSRPEKLISNKLTFNNFDNDPENEVLFFRYSSIDQKRKLILYDNNGSKLWEKQYFSRATYLEDSPTNKPFFVTIIRFVDLLGDESPEILIVWQHYRRFPAALTVYDCKGKELYFYQHSGHLHSLNLNINEYGDYQIFLTGINNLTDGEAAVIQLEKQDLIAGNSGLGPPYNIPNEYISNVSLRKYIPVSFKKATQSKFVRIKKNEMHHVFGLKYISPNKFKIDEEGIHFSIRSEFKNCEIFYYFSHNFELSKVLPNLEIQTKWNELHKEGLISESIDQYILNSEDYILYWNKGNWLTEINFKDQ